MRVLPLGLVLFFFLSLPLQSIAAPDNLADTIDASQYNPTPLEMHKALIYTALHYQWDIKEHNKDSMLWQYSYIWLKFEINGSKVTVYNDAEYDINPKWLPRINKLVLRRVEYFAKIRQAEALLAE